MSEGNRSPIAAGLVIGIIAIASATAYYFAILAPGNTLNCSVGSSGGCTTTNASVGTVSLSITDPAIYPANVTSIKVTISEIDIYSSGGTWVKVLDSSVLGSTTLDLVQIINKSQSLSKTNLVPGTYTKMRLLVSSASAMIAGSSVGLAVPTVVQTGIEVPLLFPIKVMAGSSFGALINIRADSSKLPSGIFSPILSVGLYQLLGGAVTLVSSPSVSSSTSCSSSTVSGTVTVSCTTSASSTAKSCFLGIFC